MWSIQEVWNKALEWQIDRPILSRDYIWASELGGAFVDRYLSRRNHLGVVKGNGKGEWKKRKSSLILPIIII